MPFPFEPVRDLIGVVRALRAAAVERKAGARELRRFDSVAWALQRATAVALGAKGEPHGEALALREAEDAAARVSDLVRLYDEAGAVVGAAMRRVRAAR